MDSLVNILEASGSDPSARKVGANRVDDIVTNLGQLVVERFAYVGHPAQFRGLTTNGGVTALSEYPNDGDGLFDAITGSGFTLDATGVPNDLDLTGFLLVVTQSVTTNCAGQVRLITSYTVSTRVGGIDRAWDINPSVNDSYVVLFPTWNRSELIVKAEFEAGNSLAGGCSVLPVLFDFPRHVSTAGTAADTLARPGLDGNAADRRAPRRFMGAQLDIDNLDFTTGATQSGPYYHGRARTESIRGAIGAKVRLIIAPSASKKVALWAAAV